MIRSREWWQQRSPVFLAESARLLEDLIGRDRVRCIFLCGSFAARDESIVLETEPPVLLSDVDLVVIVASLDDLVRWSPRRAALGAACEGLLPEVRFDGRVDVGLMLERDLGALPARPGVLDMIEAGRVLSGEPRTLESLPRWGPSDIRPREAVVLVENRIVSLLGRAGAAAGPPDVDWYGFRYEIAKAYTDIAAAALSIAGRYRTGYAARAELAAREGSARDPVLGALVDGELAARIAGWTRFKLDPSRAAEPPCAGSDETGTWIEAAQDILAFRHRAVSYAAGGREAVARGASAGGPAGRARGGAGRRDLVRTWRGYLRGLPARAKLEIALAYNLRLLAASPLDLIREHGVRLLEHRLERGAEAPVARPRGGFPYRGTEWRRAALELASAWRRAVFGREES